MFWCQVAQSIGLSNHKLKSALKCTVRSQYHNACPSQTDGRTDRQTDPNHGNSATINSTKTSIAKKETFVGFCQPKTGSKQPPEA